MEVSREEFFRLCLLQLAAASSFEHLLQLAITKQLQFDAFHVPPLESNQFPCWNIDLYANQYVPSDAPQNLEPLQTTGNGNCFFNAISLHFCGTERMAIEFRVRCVFTLIDMYNKICSGLLIQTMNNYMQTYLRFSGVFHILQRGQYTQEHIMTYLRTEIKETVKNNSWCGILHFYATATALQRPILSVYPDYNSNIRHNFNILVKPWFQYPNNNVAIPILWSGYINGSNWFTPNHFVPLVTVHVPLALSHNQMTRKRVSSSSGLDSSPKKPYTCLRHLKSTEDRQQNTSQEQQKDNMTLSNVLFKCYDKLPQSHCAHCSQLIMNLSKNTLCPTCISFEKKKQKSPLHTDSIYPGDIPDELLHLNSREVQLISQVHPYMKLLKLPVGGQFAQQGQTINFPVPVQEICSALPRADDHTFLLFPAKTNNNPTVVNINKVNEALTWLKTNNSGYIKTHHRTQSTQVQDSTDSNQDSRAEQPVNGNIASPEESILPLPEVSLIPNDYILPKEYENSSLKALRLPILTGQLINIFTDTSAEALAFPHLFPFGKGTYKSIQEHITWHKYFTCRLLNKDRRWSQTIAYLFWALNVYEQHSLQHCISTAVRVRSPGDTALQAQQVLAGNYSQIADDFRFMKKMKGTNAYWREQLLDLLAKMRLLGPPTFFISLSSNDNNWLEMYKFLNPQLSDDDLQLLSSSQKNQLLTENPVHAAVYFSMRWKRYLQDYLLGNTHPLGQVLDHFARIEFQNRGSPHIHAFFWIKDSPNIETIEGRQKASAFIDKYISANMPPFDDPLHSLVSRLQVHKHTHTCTKTFRATACRFGFPQPVSTTTIVQLSNLSSTTGRFYTISRDENSTWVNPYNREILSTWQANMDIQMVGCKTAAAVYVCTYVCKNEPASLRSALHKTLQTLPQDATIRQRLSKIGNLLMTHRLISAQETTFRLLNLPMVYSSRATIYINSNSPEKRHRILKPKALLRSIDPESTDIYTQNMHTIYSRRPLHDPFPTMSLVHFCTNYQLLLKSESIHPSKDHLPRYRLTGTPIEYIRERKHPAAFRTYMKSIHDDKNSHLYSMLCLFLPWRTEDDILTPYDDVATAFRQKHDLMDTPSLVAFNYSQKLEQALQEVRMLNEDIYGDIYCKITPSFCNQEDISDSQHIDNIFTMCEPSITEATDKAHKQANLSDREIRSLASLTMTDDQFQNTLDMLSQQQKTILDHITNKLDTNPPQHIFITGGAGTGKSFLLKIMREHLLRINQSSLPNVMVAAPTGVAAFNINGWTLHTLLNLDVIHNAYTQYTATPLYRGPRGPSPRTAI